MVLAGEISASQEFKDLLQPILATAIGREPQKRTLRCHNHYSAPTPASPIYKFFDSFAMRIPGVAPLWKSMTQDTAAEIPPMHPTAQLFQKELLRLPLFADMDAESLSQAAVAVVLPAWLIGTEEACHIAEAARRTFIGRMVNLESAPSSVYTAAGYELCRLSHEAFDCTGPGRIMTLESDGDGLLIATIASTPLIDWHGTVTFSARRDLTDEQMSEWINSFIGSQKPHKIILAGSGTEQPFFASDLRASSLSQYLDDPPLANRHLVAFGAAQVAKDRLESHSDDCGESRKCEELRRKADAIAGPFRPPVPTIWPSVGLRHDEL
ncbi:MAG: hypothetical protein Q9168_004160 [Polycauliona sp. 1 TL-2023]